MDRLTDILLIVAFCAIVLSGLAIIAHESGKLPTIRLRKRWPGN